MDLTPCESCFEYFCDADLQEHKNACFTSQKEAYDKLHHKMKLDLTNHQKAALEYCNKKAEEYANRDYPILIERFKGRGLDEGDLALVTSYIQNIAPVIIHLRLDNILEYLVNDIYYRNQFQTSNSNGLLSYAQRVDWESKLFGGTYGDVDGFYRVKYGPLNITNDPNGVKFATGYGDSYLLLKNEVKDRTSFTHGDSAGGMHEIATFNNFHHILNKLTDDLLNKIIKLSRGDEISFESNYGFYIECQYHGEILLDRDLECIVVNKRHQYDKNINELLQKFGQRHKCGVIWMD